ncbi:MAG: endolytic transglycosylase MltG [Bacilli bacterium]|nr:endolytic transglycosylase MltG [Bacilli bacterium]MDD3304521.1 endolytic transglycosylase MltG [Bacilli bacterium]MDD4053901.1 endolytic transglycosylase MltG [Bacilli bacterium]MDD4411270.1 endolytic transglycosylase MltG [Bacilli bacterium]
MKRFRDLAIFLFFSIGLFIIITGSLFNYYLSPVSHDIIEKEIRITDGKDIENIATMLYDENLIRNPKVFKMYLKMYGIDETKVGTLKLKQNMSSREIARHLSVDEQ